MPPRLLRPQSIGSDIVICLGLISALASCAPTTRPAASESLTPIGMSQGGAQRLRRVQAEPAPVRVEPSAPDDEEQAYVDPVVVIDRRPARRTLRGDFETPETLIVVYEAEWAEGVAQIVEATHDEAQVVLLVQRRDRTVPQVAAWRRLPHVRVLEATVDSPWIRDYGPMQTYDLTEGPIWLDYHYTWDRPKDDVVPLQLARILEARMEPQQLELEGGAIVSNGDGLCAMTQLSLSDVGLDNLDREELRNFLGELGCRTMGLIPVIPEETTGHADVVIQFVSSELALVADTDHQVNPALGEALDLAARNLAKAAKVGGHPLEIRRIPMLAEGEVFFSYVNHTRLRSRVLIPTYASVEPALEERAYTIIQDALPDVELVPISADPMVALGGAVHCVTLGLGPAARPERAVARPFVTPRPSG